MKTEASRRAATLIHRQAGLPGQKSTWPPEATQVAGPRVPLWFRPGPRCPILPSLRLSERQPASTGPAERQRCKCPREHYGILPDLGPGAIFEGMATRQEVQQAKQALKARLGHPSWLRGIGIGGRPGDYLVKVNVSVVTDEVKSKVPRSENGVSVVVEAVGTIRPLSTP